MRPWSSTLALALLWLSAAPAAAQQAGNRLVYLDAFCDAYYPGLSFPKLTTPQWVGESGVEAVVTLGIDDMRDPAKYEQYLRPLLDRLKKTQGSAAVSIMTCRVDPMDPQLQSWLKEGVSLETHTVDHPCPCLQGGDFDKAKSTYDRCVDLMCQVPNSRPVAFRFPCMDSLNTPSPRAFAEIINKTTPAGNFLQASTSVTCLFTPSDPALPKLITHDAAGDERFRRYIPFPSFVNKIENYPFPYVIGGGVWEFPCTIPDDWQAQNIQKPNNPRTVTDMIAALEATVVKKGMSNIIFHPHGWIRAEQMVEVVNAMHQKHGKRVRFLTFRSCIERINKHLLLEQPVRSSDGGDNGVRLLDLNNDGYLDVLIGNENRRVVRLWKPRQNKWHDIDSPLQLVDTRRGAKRQLGVRFGILDGHVVALASSTKTPASQLYRFENDRFVAVQTPKPLASIPIAIDGFDQGVRWMDIDRDGNCELIVGRSQQPFALQRDKQGVWQKKPWPHSLVTARGKDNGLRMVDLDKEGHADLIISNEHVAAVHLFDAKSNWIREKPVEGIKSAIPSIARNGMNGGVWFANDHMWVQNESTNRMPDGVDRRTFKELLGSSEPPPRGPQESLNSIRVHSDLRVELVAAEPLVQDPIAIDWGPDGKLWVVEMADYPLGIDDRGKPGGRVRFLEDTDGDGRYDRSTLFLDNIPFPTGVMSWKGGVLISAAPRVLWAKDTDGDGKADVSEDLFVGFGEGNQQHRVNGFEWGLDNWVYLANGDSGGKIRSARTGKVLDIRGRDLRIRPDTGEMETQSGRTQFGRHRDAAGNWFGCSNPIPVRHYVLDDHYLARNPHVKPPSLYRDLATANNAQLFPISTVLSHWSGYKPPGPGQPHKFTSACSTSVYEDEVLGDEYDHNTFTCEPVHNAVHRRTLTAEGFSFRSERPANEKGREFLASSDSWFRPTTVTEGPDGALWVVDMYRLVIEHPEWIDDQREKELFLRAGHDRGRIYRIYPKTRMPNEIKDLSKMSGEELALALFTQNRRTRDLAHRLLLHRDDPKANALLRTLVVHSPNAWTRMHALCVLDGLGEASLAEVATALRDPAPHVRRHAIRVSERWLRSGDEPAVWWGRFMRLADDQPQVQLQLAYSMGESKQPAAAGVLAKLSAEANPTLRAAIFSSLNEALLPAYYVALGRQPSSESVEECESAVLQVAARTGNDELLDRILAGFAETPASNAQSRRRRWETMTRGLRQLKQLRPKSEVASHIGKLTKQAGELAVRDESPVGDRTVAIGFLGQVLRLQSNDAIVVPLALPVGLMSASQPLEVQQAAARSLAQSQDLSAMEQPLQRLAALSPLVSADVVAAALTREAWTKSLLAAMKRNKNAIHVVSAAARQSLLEHPNEGIRKQALDLFGQRSTDRAALVSKTLQAISTLPQGKASIGQTLFAKHCLACHQAPDANGKVVGNPVGPSLATLKNRSLAAIVTAVLDPSRAVEAKYQGYLVRTDDGRQWSGVIESESSAAIQLRLQKGERMTLLRTDIEAIKNSGKSFMPEGLEKELTPESLAHLTAYVQTLGPAPKSFAGNDPQTVTPGDKGRFVLGAETAAIFGPTLVFESKYKNLGFWGSRQDRASWTIKKPSGGDKQYDVFANYACANDAQGNVLEVTCGTQSVRLRVKGTGSWDNYQTVKIGTIQLSDDNVIPVNVSAVASGTLQGYLMDLRSIELRPKQE